MTRRGCDREQLPVGKAGCEAFLGNHGKRVLWLCRQPDRTPLKQTSNFMASHPILYPPIIWTNQNILVFHGTVDTYAPAVLAGPILVSRGRTHTDFGPGFYTTTLMRQAHTWAAQIASTKPGTKPAVIELAIAREDLAGLQSLAFARGDFHAEDFWSLIHHCRKGASDHGRRGLRGSYDVVYGPVAAFWNQRMIIGDADQISFHTPAAEGILNKSARRRII